MTKIILTGQVKYGPSQSVWSVVEYQLEVEDQDYIRLMQSESARERLLRMHCVTATEVLCVMMRLDTARY